MQINIDNSILFILAVSFLMTFMSTPIAKMIAAKIGAIDIPKDGRRMHKDPIPRMGGLAMFYGFIISVIVFIPLERQLIGMLLGAVIVVTLGIFDDCKSLDAKFKFIIQIIAAAITVSFGLSIKFFTNPFPIFGEIIEISSPYTEIISVIWIVGITNAVNFIDGLDGLAAGVSSIASLSILFIALIMNNMELAMLSAALVGCCVGFLPFNTNPAKIFMGDTGATFLGFMLATMSIQGAFKGYALISFVIPFLVLGLPIFDTAFAIIRRIIHHQPIMTADRGHLHHRLIDMGFNQKQTVSILYSATSILGLSAVVMAGRGPVKGLILLASVIPVLITSVCFTLERNHKKEDANNEESKGEDNNE